jgi:ligand-binding SRPBCC domain-containing protein
MRPHQIIVSMSLPLQRARVFEFFSKAENLEKITPAELHFRILSPLPIQMRAGVRINYRLGLYGIPMTWVTEITRWNPPEEFIDEQRAGPYALWIHRHLFREDGKGNTSMEDRVDYKLPFYPLGEMAFPLVRRQLRRIFNYRQQTVRRLLIGGENIQVPGFHRP